jgi:hypothetical protein
MARLTLTGYQRIEFATFKNEHERRQGTFGHRNAVLAHISAGPLRRRNPETKKKDVVWFAINDDWPPLTLADGRQTSRE